MVGSTPSSPPQSDPTGVEVLVGAMVTYMVCHLFISNKSLMMFLLLVSLRTLEQLLSDCCSLSTSRVLRCRTSSIRL